MKIISGYKDYYDYLVGIYGQDDKLVLDRRKYTYINYPQSNFNINTIHIGEYMIEGVWYEENIYYGNDVEQFADQNRKSFFSLDKEHSKDEYWLIPDAKYSHKHCLKGVKYLGDKSPTWKEDCPILLGKKDFQHYPILKDYNVSSFLEPNLVWQYLNDWLSKKITKKENNISPVSDKIKIVSAGFDLKTSFRH